MKIIVSAGFPYKNRGNYIHSEQQGDVLFISQELMKSVREHLIKKDIAEFQRIILLHRDHTAVYSSDDRKGDK